MMLLFPGFKVTSCTFSICAPSFMPTVGGLTQLGVSGGELLSRRRISRWVFLHTTPVELRELSEGLLSWISSSSNEGPADAVEWRPADELPWLNSTVTGFVCLWAPLDLIWVPPRSMSKWMLAASCCMCTETGIKHLSVSSTCRMAPECTEAVAGWNCSRVSWAKTLMPRVTLWAGEREIFDFHLFWQQEQIYHTHSLTTDKWMLYSSLWRAQFWMKAEVSSTCWKFST